MNVSMKKVHERRNYREKAIGKMLETATDPEPKEPVELRTSVNIALFLDDIATALEDINDVLWRTLHNNMENRL